MTRKLRAGIVGTGNAAVMHTNGMRPVANTEVLAVCSRDESRAKAFAGKHDIARAYGDLPTMLADPDVDVIHICTPPSLHVEQALDAIAAAKHVLIDKPIARTVADARIAVAAAEAAGLTLGGVFQKRFTPLAQQLKAAIQANQLGDLVMCDAFLKWWRDESYFANSPWRATRNLEGGGALINQGIHMVDLLVWIAGPVEEVVGAVATRAHKIEMEDAASAVLRFASGAIGVVQASTATWPGFPERLELHGTLGTVVLNEGQGTLDWQLRGEEPRTTTLDRPAQSGSSDPNAISLAGHTAQFADFYSAIRERRQPLVSGVEATRALEVVQAIRIASARRALVRLPLSDRDAAELP